MSQKFRALLSIAITFILFCPTVVLAEETSATVVMNSCAFTDGSGNRVESVIPGGRLMIEANVTTDMSDGFSLVLAVYSNGKLETASIAKQMIIGTDTMVAEINPLPNVEGCVAKVFLWKDTENMSLVQRLFHSRRIMLT